MIWLYKPSAEQIRAFVAQQGQLAFGYPEVGATRQAPPPGYLVDHNRVWLGVGLATFEQAKIALQQWEMFNLGWVQLCWPAAALAPGTGVAVLAHALGLWSLNACRIVYVVNEADRYGFAYGTLPDHLERGEERFMVEWHKADNSVWYDILAFSRPNQWLAQIGYPVVRQFQKRFARDSKRAMQRRLQNQR